MARTTPVNAGYTVVNGDTITGEEFSYATMNVGTQTGTWYGEVNTWLEYKELELSDDDKANNRSRVSVFLYSQMTDAHQTGVSNYDNYINNIGYISFCDTSVSNPYPYPLASGTTIKMHGGGPSAVYVDRSNLNLWAGTDYSVSQWYYLPDVEYRPGGDAANRIWYNAPRPAYDWRQSGGVWPVNKLAEGTLTIPHNPDGTRSVKITAYFDTGNTHRSVRMGWASADLTLQPVPVAQPSSIASISKSSVSYGESFNVTVTRPTSACRERVMLKYGTNYSQTKIISDYTATSSTSRDISIPLDWGNPTNASGFGLQSPVSFKVAIQTFYGNDPVGSEVVDGTVRTVSFSAAQKSTGSMASPTFGHNPAITITRGVSYFTDDVYIQYCNSTGTTVAEEVQLAQNSQATSITSYTIPYNHCPTNAVVNYCRLRVVSKNNGTQVANEYSSVYTITIASGDNHYNPSLNSSNLTNTVSNTTIPALGSTAMIGYSNMVAQIPSNAVTTQEGATVSSATISFSSGVKSGTQGIGNNITSNTIDRASFVTTYSITDSRGLIATASKTVSAVAAPADPTISSCTVYRGNSSGTADETGTYIFATVSASAQPVSGVTNTLTLTATVNGGSAITLTNGQRTTLMTNASPAVSYTVIVTASDLFHAVSQTKVVPAESVSFNIKYGGKGLGIGKYATNENGLDLAYNLFTDGNVVYKNYQGINNAGVAQTIDNRNKGLSIYYVTYCAINGSGSTVSNTSHAGVVILYDTEQIAKLGFEGATTTNTSTGFTFLTTSSGNRMKYRVFENNLGRYS